MKNRLRPRLPLITVFGLGHMRPASGTWGSLPPVVLAMAMWACGAAPGTVERGIGASAGPTVAMVVYIATLVSLLLVFSAACVVHGSAAEAIFGHDPSEVVADETAGQCLPLLGLAMVPGCFADFWTTSLWLGAAFIAFRVFDIVKPWPANSLQRVAGGWGILLDDLMAGIYAAAVVVGAGWWWA